MKRKGLVDANPAFCQNACITNGDRGEKMLFSFLFFFLRSLRGGAFNVRRIERDSGRGHR